MTRMTRRSVLIGAAASVAAMPVISLAPARANENHDILMLNKDPDDARARMVFYPKIIKIAMGDSVTFVPTDKGHNCVSTPGMVPEGAAGWKSKFNEQITVTPDRHGVYGYHCVPHKAMGMVGLLLVEGEGMLDNLEAAKAFRQVGLSRRVWAGIWTQAEADGLI